MLPLYLSTGAFISRKNNRDFTLLSRFYDQLNCDGFEFLVFQEFYERWEALSAEYRALEIPIPLIHGDKHIGDLLSSPEEEAFAQACELMKVNCAMANRLRAKKMVLHCWGVPNSDLYSELIYTRLQALLDIAQREGQIILAENTFVKYADPLKHLEELAKRYPQLEFIIDTRCAQFHAQLPETCKSTLFKERVTHLHINDYGGGYKEWAAIYPILQPGKGVVQWGEFFSNVKAAGYTGTVTLEAPAMLEEGVDTKTFNDTLKYLRENLCG